VNERTSSRSTLSGLVAASSSWEHEPVPITPSTQHCAWAAVIAAAACIAWLTLGNQLVSAHGLHEWPVTGTVLGWSLLGPWRMTATVIAAILLGVGLFLAWLTAGFTSAGPRLQWIVLGHAGAAGLTGVFPAVALAAVAITFILIAAIAFLITAAVATVAWSLVSTS
jgi:hypothetical protein